MREAVQLVDEHDQSNRTRKLDGRVQPLEVVDNGQPLSSVSNGSTTLRAGISPPFQLVAGQDKCLVISIYITTVTAFQDAGILTSYIRPNELCGREWTNILGRIKASYYELIWIDCLSNNIFCGGKDEAEIWNRLHTCIEAAVKSTVNVVVAGCWHRCWQNATLTTLRRTGVLFESKHQWCAFDVRILGTENYMSSVRHVICSNPPFPDSPCCGQPAEAHKFDLDFCRERGMRRLRGIAESSFVTKLIARFELVSSRSPQSCVTPLRTSASFQNIDNVGAPRGLTRTQTKRVSQSRGLTRTQTKRVSQSRGLNQT